MEPVIQNTFCVGGGSSVVHSSRLRKDDNRYRSNTGLFSSSRANHQSSRDRRGSRDSRGNHGCHDSRGHRDYRDRGDGRAYTIAGQRH